MKLEKWMEEIKQADGNKALDEIVERAANDDSLTAGEYTQLYRFADSRARRWTWGVEEFRIERAEITETGGGIRIYTGELRSGDFFFTSTDWESDVLLLWDDPDENWDDNGDPEWQKDHTVRELTGTEALHFWLEMLDYLEWCSPDDEREIHRERRVVKAELQNQTKQKG